LPADRLACTSVRTTIPGRLTSGSREATILDRRLSFRSAGLAALARISRLHPFPVPVIDFGWKAAKPSGACPETMAGGVAVFDYNNDGYWTSSSPTEPTSGR